MKVDIVVMRTLVGEFNPHDIAFGHAQAGARHAPVIRPSGEKHIRCDFDFAIDRNDLEFPNRLAVRSAADFAAIPVAKHSVRVEAIALVIDLADGAHLAMFLISQNGRAGPRK